MDSKSNNRWWKSLFQRVFGSRHKTGNELVGSDKDGANAGQADPAVKKLCAIIYNEEKRSIEIVEFVCFCGNGVVKIGEPDYSGCLHCDSPCFVKDCLECEMLFMEEESWEEDGNL